ncbi:type II restriction endonuclease [Stenotrophomonas oahuensis]|uniref:Type II restriction endonuclease n=1 Tax=Stenotrophomonas oahuensis TaxID=3003271 RepID=A0ABY9YUI3_9GAMM|nr:type II restriction endonuclease [Stenotrophomonas sp. A5586]WNH54501.1 type II restriction endonuclease [Stenotrophomonas sp. A5586]
MKTDIVSEGKQTDWKMVEELALKSRKIFLKKLSRNDTSWSMPGGSNQSGFYVPRDIRESRFFPALEPRKDLPHIEEAKCPSYWPQADTVRDDSHIRYFTNKTSECHFTRIPKELFQLLNPASWLLGGTLVAPEGLAHHWFMVIDSQSAAAELLETRLDVSSDFHFGLFDPAALSSASKDQSEEAAQLEAEIQAALLAGTIESLLLKYSRLPSPEQLSKQARNMHLKTMGYGDLNPWELERPGDAVMRISRDIEYAVYRQHELRLRAVEVAAILAKHKSAASAAVQGFRALDAAFLSASQQRKSRGGRSFESHLDYLLRAGGVRSQPQAILGQRRPDFVMPDARTVRDADRKDYYAAAILSAKTTLRERWKQITHERFNCSIFLATVDDRISVETLNELREAEITLVVPESMKAVKTESLYRNDSNVISFRSFFDDAIAVMRPNLLLESGMILARQRRPRTRVRKSLKQ